MKRFFNLALVIVLVLSLLAGCAGNKTVEQPAANEQENTESTSADAPKEDAKYEDGIYFAQEDEFNEKSGWKYVVTFEVKDGKIASVDWTGVHKNGGTDKKTRSVDGQYPMVENGKAKAHWHEQAKIVEAYLIEKQDPTAIEFNDDAGHTDAIAGASITVKPLFTLTEKALANGPVGKGKYKDGAYHAEAAEFDQYSGWKDTVDLTVVNGNIIVANWSGVHKDGGDDKKTASLNGAYPMVENGGAQSHWHEQAVAVEAHLISSQDPTDIQYKDDGVHTDAISGVSITVSQFFKLAEEALAKAQ